MERISHPSAILKFLLFTFLFILFTIVGTLSHELGHIIVAKLLGYTTELYFAYMNTINSTENDLHSFLITLGGPIQTVLTGTIGYFLLNKSVKKNGSFTTTDYLWFFLSLFWLRQVFNLLYGFIQALFLGNSNLFGGDELKLSLYLDLPSGFFSILFAFIGIFICYRTFFHLLSKKERALLIISGALGSLIGFWFWVIKFGSTFIL